MTMLSSNPASPKLPDGCCEGYTDLAAEVGISTSAHATPIDPPTPGPQPNPMPDPPPEPGEGGPDDMPDDEGDEERRPGRTSDPQPNETRFVGGESLVASKPWLRNIGFRWRHHALHIDLSSPRRRVAFR